MVLNPATATLAQANAFKTDLENLKQELENLSSQFKTYQSTVMPPFSHIVRHGRALDQPISSWSWRDVSLSSRTNALVRALRTSGDGSAATIAFAFGAATGYSANAVASSYVGHVVGGPRRSHRTRDRVARNTIGAWLRIHEPAVTSSLADLRSVLGTGSSAVLPAAIKSQILNALASTYPAGVPGAAPDLDAGYVHLLRHIELLDSFPRPPLPADIPGLLLTKIQDSPEASGVLYQPQDWGGPGDDSIPKPGSSPGQGKKGDGGCDWLGWAILAILILFAFLMYKWISGKWPWENDSLPPGESPGESQEALDSFLTSEAALMFVVGLYQIHTTLYDAMITGAHYLKRIGMIYPDEMDLPEPTFGQFTSLPTGVSSTNYPRLPMPDPDHNYLIWPTSALENPGTSPSPYPAAATPSVLLHGLPGSFLPTLGAHASTYWRQTLNPVTADTVNLDLDSDRGYLHKCWRVAPGGSIGDDPVPVQDLGYGQVT